MTNLGPLVDALTQIATVFWWIDIATLLLTFTVTGSIVSMFFAAWRHK